MLRVETTYTVENLGNPCLSPIQVEKCDAGVRLRQDTDVVAVSLGAALDLIEAIRRTYEEAMASKEGEE